jgi:iron complex outermembrane receptor protein
MKHVNKAVLPAFRSSRSIHLAGVIGVLALNPCTVAWSAEGDSEDSFLEEVTVTAQFRRETLQTVPIAITALDAEKLEARGMSTIHDLSSSAPNLIISRGTHSQGPIAQTFIRGVGQGDGHLGFEPGVGFYLDDVYYGVMLGSDFELSDARVEILRGPQGTLAGKNSIGGSIKLFSKKPTADTDGYLSAGYGDFDRTVLKGAGNIALTDNLFVRLSGYYKKVDGYMDRIDYACANPGSGAPTLRAGSSNCKLGTEGGEDVRGARAALRWVPSDAIENTLTVYGSRDRSEVAAEKLLFLNNPLVPGGGSQFITGPRSYVTYSSFVTQPFTDPARYLTPTPRPGAGTHGSMVVPTNMEIDSYGASNVLEWKLGEALSFSSISGFRDNQGTYGIYQGGGPYVVQILDNEWSQKQFTQELRLNGTAFSMLDWTVGGYYYDQEAIFGGTKILSPGTVNETLFQGRDPVPSTSKSAFAHGVWRLTQQLSLITGVRYTEEEKSYEFERRNPFAPGPSYTPVGLLDGSSARYSGNNTDYRAGVQYQWTPSFMTYLQYSTGFRGGGVNPRPFVVEQEVSFGPETVGAAEFGIKADLLNKRLRINAATFFNRYEDIIFSNTSPTIINGVLVSANNLTPVNAGDADIKGVELEVTAFLGGLQIDASGSYLDFQFKRIGAAGALISGVSLDTEEPFAPEHKYSLGLQYAFDFDLGTITPRLDADYQAEFFTDINNSREAKVDARTLVNARLSWASATDTWQAALISTNVLDKFYYINKFRNAPPTNFVAGQPGAPRQVWMTVQRNF